MTESELRRTPLYQQHCDLGGKIVPFAGWELPVRYSGLIEEHSAVRERVGIFDVSHMGEFTVKGPEAERALNYLTCNDVSRLVDGKAQYTALTNPSGGIVDDLLIYRYSAEDYLLCVNAANTAKDFAWILEHNRFDAEVYDVSQQYGQIALQGPRAVELGAQVCPQLGELAGFYFAEVSIDGVELIAARTGYTGEDGFEFFVPAEAAAQIWNLLLDKGKAFGILPAGLGARDTLRLEACYPLHGHELGDEISVLESGLGWVLKLDKGDFVGSEALAAEKQRGAARRLVGFEVVDRGIVRDGAELFFEGQKVGRVTSGTQSPTLGKAIGLALVEAGAAKSGTLLQAAVRGKMLNCQLVKKPFYRRSKG